MRYTLAFGLLALAVLAPGHPAAAAVLGKCAFDTTALSFKGSALEQARCLLRKVKVGAQLDDAPAVLPAPLDKLIGQPVALTKAQLRGYLAVKRIAEQDLGGSLDKGVSKTGTGRLARYFVIHDTSAPNCSVRGACAEQGKFPPNINDASWPFNDAKLVHRHKSGNPVAHVFNGRTGISRSVDGFGFDRAMQAVKLEGKAPGARGLFLHVENVQPRIGRPAIPAPGKKANDLIAPDPGFTAAQYERLALIYVAASLRRGEWLIPAFHAVMDVGIPDAHDDPQSFDLDAWAQALASVTKDIAATK
jgi:hypothetical protein